MYAAEGVGRETQSVTPKRSQRRRAADRRIRTTLDGRERRSFEAVPNIATQKKVCRDQSNGMSRAWQGCTAVLAKRDQAQRKRLTGLLRGVVSVTGQFNKVEFSLAGVICGGSAHKTGHKTP